MKKLSTLVGNAERFIVQSWDYLGAKIALFKYNLNPKKYDIKNPLVSGTLADAKLTISLWEKGKTLDN